MNNRVAFITGASRGIGRACALALSQAGARVVAGRAQIARSWKRLRGEIRARAGRGYVVEIDLASADSIKEAFANVRQRIWRASRFW